MQEDYYKKYELLSGSWHITRFIGEGSFGKVFEIQREDFGMVSKAALKVITIPSSPKEISAVPEEATIPPSIPIKSMDKVGAHRYAEGVVRDMTEKIILVNKLKGSGNIVGADDYQIIEHKDGGGWDILIRMELLMPLDQYIQQHLLSPREIVTLGIDLCRALESCRRHNIIHRDIKPSNIFRADDGTFRLGDFSVAEVLTGTCQRSSVQGTYAYMAPEMYQREDYDFSIDLYSLGLVLYQLLNDNRLPFLPESPAPITYADRENALAKRFNGIPLPRSSHANRQLWQIVQKACAYDPIDRYSHPAQMRQELECLDVFPPEPPEFSWDTKSQQAVYTWPAAWKGEDILRFWVGFGDGPIRCFACDGENLTARNEIDVCRDGGRTFPEGYFYPVTIRLSEEQKEQLRYCLAGIPRERWASDPQAIEYDLQCPTGYMRHVYFSCELKNGGKFDYIPGKGAAPGFVQLCRCLMTTLPESGPGAQKGKKCDDGGSVLPDDGF